MRGIKAKKIRHARFQLSNQFHEEVARACQDKRNMPNRHGEAQHEVISDKRQLAKMIRREKLHP